MGLHDLLQGWMMFVYHKKRTYEPLRTVTWLDDARTSQETHLWAPTTYYRVR
jgi:hypothetical protein